MFPSLEMGEQNLSLGEPSMRLGASRESGRRLISLIFRSSFRMDRRYSFLLVIPSIAGRVVGGLNSRQVMITLVSKKVSLVGEDRPTEGRESSRSKLSSN